MSTAGWVPIDLFSLDSTCELGMQTEPTETEISKDQQSESNALGIKRLPRWQFRKERKKLRRQNQRRLIAQERDKDSPIEESEESKKERRERELKEHAEYLQRKKAWEDRERQYNLINMARKKVEEAEKRAKEIAQQKWREALLRMPVMPPSFPSRSGKTQIRIQNGPTFVPGSDDQEHDDLS